MRSVSGKKQKRKITVAVFTLMEMVVVIAIIALLAGVATPFYMRHLRRARQAQAKAQVKMLEQAVNDFNLDTRHWPKSLQDLLNNSGDKRWDGPYLANTAIIPKDPWGNDYVFIQPGSHGDFDIVCYGSDGASGGTGDAADIGNWIEAE